MLVLEGRNIFMSSGNALNSGEPGILSESGETAYTLSLVAVTQNEYLYSNL